MPLERVWPKDVYVRSTRIASKLYTQVIKATNTRVSIHVAGTLPFDKDQNLVGEGSMRLQVRAVLDAIGKSLAAVGARPSDVVRTKTYVTDMDAYMRKVTRNIWASSARRCRCRPPWESPRWRTAAVSSRSKLTPSWNSSAA
jgi:enamine deaminase RidA (YjgF/YER057c/UK114 family)